MLNWVSGANTRGRSGGSGARPVQIYLVPIIAKERIPFPSNIPATTTAPKIFAKNSAISTGATVCFSRLELTLHGSPALFLAADVVVLPLHTRH